MDVCVGPEFTRCFLVSERLLKGIIKGSCFVQACLAVISRHVLTLLSTFINGTYLLVGYLSHGFIATDAELALYGALL